VGKAGARAARAARDFGQYSFAKGIDCRIYLEISQL
jgi:hypothetical protein